MTGDRLVSSKQEALGLAGTVSPAAVWLYYTGTYARLRAVASWVNGANNGGSYC